MQCEAQMVGAEVSGWVIRALSLLSSGVWGWACGMAETEGGHWGREDIPNRKATGSCHEQDSWSMEPARSCVSVEHDQELQVS